MLHIPILRRGRPYTSLDAVRVAHYRTREPFAEISQANAGLIRRDLLSEDEAREALAARSVRDLIGICGRAADHFLNDELPLGDATQSREDYVRQVTATTGLPHALARRNMVKIHGVLSRMETVLRGLTRDLDPAVLDAGVGEHRGRPVSFFPRTRSLGVVLPGNSPGVHSLWVPAIAMKIPLVLKPGSAEPWTPYRIAQALMRAGCPPDAFGYYPTDHAGSGEILRLCGRSMVFGDSGSTDPWRDDPRVEIHGPGYSKILIGEDRIGEWESYLDVMVSSIVDNGGRSCINASGIWVPSHGREVAEALAERLARVAPRAEDDEAAEIAPFADPAVAARISQAIDAALEQPGASDVSARHRRGGRLVTWNGCTYLLPTIVAVEGPGHPLANREFLFSFASVVETPQEAMPESLGRSLVVTAITEDQALIRRLLAAPTIDRLNLGPIPTVRIGWDQPHEGNLFDHLYGRRAIQRSA